MREATYKKPLNGSIAQASNHVSPRAKFPVMELILVMGVVEKSNFTTKVFSADTVVNANTYLLVTLSMASDENCDSIAEPLTEPI